MSQNPSHTNDEIRAFDFFRTKVAVNLSGAFDSTFWTSDILQVAQREDPVRHAIVALASLSETMLKATSNSSKSSPEVFAIRQHAKAISDLRKGMQQNIGWSPEVILISCALFICFEMFQSHHESALSQMSSGVFVFYNWHSKLRRESYSSSLGWREISSELTIQLERIFGRLMLQTILFIDTKPAEWKFITPAFTPALPSIPSNFSSIDKARDCLDSCLCSIYHQTITAQFQGLKTYDFSESPAGPASQLGLDSLNQWSTGFKSFILAYKGTFPPKEQKAAILLEVQQLTGFILASAAPFTQETIFDSFEKDFSQIITLAAHFLSNNNGSDADPETGCFPAFDMGILPHLYLVASRCRHPSIRRQALQLLQLGPRQEGIWHRDVLANTAERIMAIEESGLEGVLRSADIPASARLSVMNATIDSRNQTITLHCGRLKAGEGGKIEVIHDLVEY